jgi:hypothetical protein
VEIFCVFEEAGDRFDAVGGVVGVDPGVGALVDPFAAITITTITTTITTTSVNTAIIFRHVAAVGLLVVVGIILVIVVTIVFVVVVVMNNPSAVRIHRQSGLVFNPLYVYREVDFQQRVWTTCGIDVCYEVCDELGLPTAAAGALGGYLLLLLWEEERKEEDSPW